MFGWARSLLPLVLFRPILFEMLLPSLLDTLFEQALEFVIIGILGQAFPRRHGGILYLCTPRSEERRVHR